MKNNVAKNTISKLKENQIKVKKKGENNNQSIKTNNKSQKNKELLYKTTFNTNTNFYTLIEKIPKYSTNKTAYNTIIQEKKMNLDMKNKNKFNDFGKINCKYFTNRKSGNPINLKEKKLNILKDKAKENISNNYSIKDTKNIGHPLNSKKINKNEKILDIHLFIDKANHSYEKIKQIIDISSLNSSIPKNRKNKKIKSGKTNLKSFEIIQKNIKPSQINVKEITNLTKKILPIKKNNSTTNSKYETYDYKSNSNSYYSCYDFYKKKNKSKNNMNRNNYNFNKMLNTINNFEFHNYSNIYKIEENTNDISKNKSKNYILFENENINMNREKLNLNPNIKHSIQNTEYKKYVKHSFYNNKNNKDKNNNSINKERILDKYVDRDNNKLIEYKSKLIQYFCKGIEDFIFMSVKKNFNYFIKNLKQYSIEKNIHHLLLKRLQNKSIQKNFFKDKEKASFYNYLHKNDNDLSHSTITKMNNSNIINLRRKKEGVLNVFSRGYIEKRSNNFSKVQSPSLTEYYDRNHKYFEKINYSDNINSDIQDKENVNYLNMINYQQNSKLNNNNMNRYFDRNNNLIKGSFNLDCEREDRKSETFIQNNILYIPKKLQLINNSKTLSINTDEKPYNSHNNSYISSPFLNYSISHNIFSKKSNQNKLFNQSHDIFNTQIQSRIGRKKYGSNENFQNNNTYNDNNINILNNTNAIIMNRKNYNISGKTFDTNINEKSCIYKKKLKINTYSKMYIRPKPTKIRNQILDINLQLNNNLNESIGQNLSPNIDKKINQSLIINPNDEAIKKQSIMPINLYNYSNIRMYTEPRREIYFNLNQHQQNKSGNIRELTVNLNNNNILNKNKDNIFIYSKNDFDNCMMKEYKYNNIKNDDNEINEESDDYFIKEIIIKDVSSSDGRLNVFIKYIEMPNLNKHIVKKLSNNNFGSLKYVQIDSFSIPSMYRRKMLSNIYYKNYCYGNRFNNSKIKFNKILSSILEEEEKSKVAGSINNSLISEEEQTKNTNRFSHFFLKSIKYFVNLLQNILDDKKKDSYNKFFKIMRKIKNDSYLQGLINEKKHQNLNKSKNEEKDNKKKKENIIEKKENNI